MLEILLLRNMVNINKKFLCHKIALGLSNLVGGKRLKEITLRKDIMQLPILSTLRILAVLQANLQYAWEYK